MNNVLSFGSGYRLFSSYWWKHWLRPGTYYWPFVYAYQRVTRGWANCDTWSLDHHLCLILPPALERLRSTKYGVPTDLTEEQWDEILATMAEGFRAGIRSQKIPDQFVTHLETSTGLWKDLKMNDIEIDHAGLDAYQTEERQKFDAGMALFHKYFFSLWD